ncbi:hypothetical protein ABZY93_27935 [Streptomyces smyrnaeus]
MDALVTVAVIIAMITAGILLIHRLNATAAPPDLTTETASDPYPS